MSELEPIFATRRFELCLDACGQPRVRIKPAFADAPVALPAADAAAVVAFDLRPNMGGVNAVRFG